MSEKAKLLIVDDDPALIRLLDLYLSKADYEVISALSGVEGVREFYQQRPDLVVLDIMMPGMDGWKVCERIREMADVPIIMLTARGEESDRVKGLRMGADDYVVKPFSMRELAARVDAVLRRSRLSREEQSDPTVYTDDYLTVDAERSEIRCAGELVDLTPIEQKLLFLLVENRGRLLTTDQILTNVWGFEYRGETNYVRLYIWRLRQKIEPKPDEPRYIQTEHGMGYRFVEAS